MEWAGHRLEISISTGKLQCQFNVAFIVHWLQFLGVNVEWWILYSWVVQFFLHGNLGNFGMLNGGFCIVGWFNFFCMATLVISAWQLEVNSIVVVFFKSFFLSWI